MIVVYITICGRPSEPIRFIKDAAEHASVTSHAMRDAAKLGASTSVWLVPGTGEG